MEKYITYNLLEDDSVLWRHHSKKQIIDNDSEWYEIVPRFSMPVFFGFCAFATFSLNQHIRVWGTLAALAAVSAIIIKKKLLYTKLESQTSYYLTDEKIVIVKKTGNTLLVREQSLLDIDKLEAKRKDSESYNIFFSPVKNINIFEMKSASNKRKVNVTAPMCFFAVKDIDELFVSITKHKNIDIFYESVEGEIIWNPETV